MKEPVPIITDDGSSSLYVSDLNETYHSTFGALAESEFVFIGNGYRFVKNKNQISMFETGFGTGLNTLLTALEAEKQSVLTTCYAIEKFPVSDKIISTLNYPELTGERGVEIFSKIHSAPWDELVSITNWFKLKKICADILTYDWKAIPDFDLVYFDAFSPDKQPEIWNAELFREIYGKMSKGAIFVTYCAKGSVRRDLIRTGFAMERLPGPKGKREMLRGLKF
jgi:tRNA U34 5-methylaminomethyl-2-thiouridine-forming methyltransferase MnmC